MLVCSTVYRRSDRENLYDRIEDHENNIKKTIKLDACGKNNIKLNGRARTKRQDEIEEM